MATKQPDDKSHFILPDLGEGVHEAELIRWRVKPGEQVAEHQTLAEMETDKALVEVPSPWAGVVKELRGNEGDIINVGSILVTYDIGASAGSAAGGAAARQAGSASPGGNHNATSTAVADRGDTAGDGEEREDAGTVVGSVGGTLTVSEAFTRRRHEAPGSEARRKALATPAVRRLAKERGIDINAVPGTGRGGRVTASDVQAFAGTATAATPATPTTRTAPTAAPLPVAVAGEDERIPFRGVRRTIAEALDRSVKTAVHFTVVDEADVTALEKKRHEYSNVLGHKLSLLPFVMMAVCRALRMHPGVNANVDDANGEIIRKADINLGCAVDTDHGLMVPVIPGADALGLAQLSESVKTLAEACRDRSIPRERLLGGTFTISNVGSYGGMFATPIINYPEVGILAVGRACERVLVRDGMFYAGRILPLSMSCDHRVVDGAEGARFLNTVVRLLESPAELLGA